jgi:hypothetical protein
MGVHIMDHRKKYLFRIVDAKNRILNEIIEAFSRAEAWQKLTFVHSMYETKEIQLVSVKAA